MVDSLRRALRVRPSLKTLTLSEVSLNQCMTGGLAYLHSVGKINQHYTARFAPTTSSIQADRSDDICPATLNEVAHRSKFEDLQSLALYVARYAQSCTQVRHGDFGWRLVSRIQGKGIG